MKKLKYVLALFIAAVMIFAVGCSAKIELHDVSEYRKILDYKDGFKVMMLTDIHISRLSNLEEISKYADKIVNSLKNSDSFDYLYNTYSGTYPLYIMRIDYKKAMALNILLPSSSTRSSLMCSDFLPTTLLVPWS